MASINLSEWDEERVAEAIAAEFSENMTENFQGKQGYFTLLAFAVSANNQS